MTRVMRAFCVAVACIVSAASVAAAMPKAITITPDQVKWMSVKGMTGAQMAVMYGNPNGAGTYTLRLKLEDGPKVGAHWHPDAERVTVLSGTLLFGIGDKVDMSKAKAYPAGSFLFIPSPLHHFAIAKGDTIVQVTGSGPFKMNMVK